MVKRDVKVINKDGLHLRPSGALVEICNEFKCKIYIYDGDRKIIGKSVLNIMAAGVKEGTVVTVVCNGVDEDEALKAVCKGIEDGLGEKSYKLSGNKRL